MLEIVFLDILGQVVHLETQDSATVNPPCALSAGRVRGSTCCWVYLDRAGHGAQGEERSAVLDGRLTVKHSLSVHQQDSHLQDRQRDRTVRASEYVCVSVRDCTGVCPTLLPSGFSTTNTSLQARMPVVSLSQPPRQLKPVRGSSSPPIQVSDVWGGEKHPTS